MNSARHTLKELLSDDKPRLVVQHLIDITRNLDDEAHNELVIISAQLKAYESRQVKGLAVFSELFVEKAKIHNALLHIIDNLPADVPDISVKKTKKSQPQNSVETVTTNLPTDLTILPTQQVVQQAKPYFSLAKWVILGSSIVAIATTVALLSKSKETTATGQPPSATTGIIAPPSVSTAKPSDLPVSQIPTSSKTATGSNVPTNPQKPNQPTAPTAVNTPQPAPQNVETPTTTPAATPSVQSNETAVLEENDWKSTETANTTEAYKQFLAKYPKSQHTTVERRRQSQYT
jgi:Effector-associated domain 11